MADDDLPRLSGDEKAALAALLKRTIDGDRYPFSSRIGTLRGIFGEAAATENGAGPSSTTTAAAPRAATGRGKAAEGKRLRHDRAMHLSRLCRRGRGADGRRLDVVSRFGARSAGRLLLSSA